MDDKLHALLGLAEFSDDEATLMARGTRYVAMQAGAYPMQCTGGVHRCAFAQGLGCELFDLSGHNTRCGSDERKDGRGIVWVRAT